ncbi:mitochondrial amidoxime-reducing component 1-like [Patiria miniata]|uniref:MOSC domain-containing protein n=1 Tax=Patiria miniata TaxID=46514 RepID=A0A914BC87_PATMI|nr:mitochondrial amidoxime-reducing component 1-like [Patiria miniata]
MLLSQIESLGLTTTHQRLVIAGAVGLATIAGVVWWFRRTPKPVFKPVGKLSEIWIHPVKSCRGHQVSSAECTPAGLYSNGLYDRYFAVLSDANRTINLGQEPSLALIQPRISEDGECLSLDAPGMEPLSISLSDTAKSDNPVRAFRVWGVDAEGLDCGQEAETWLSTYLKKPNHKLVYYKEGRTKLRKPTVHSMWGKKFASKDELRGYQDLAPLLVVTQASLDDLNSHLEKPITMRNFRPNLVVSGANAFDEDLWKHIRIGDTVTLRRTHGCGRCKLTTVDNETGMYRSDNEPLTTLRKYRMLDKSDPDSKTLGVAPIFGSNVAYDVFGTVQVGDTVYAAV